jgi:cytochrome b involved in lipid metabolism
MKILSTISLWIFGVVVSAILIAGLLFYQNKQNNQALSNQDIQNKVANELISIPLGITLDMKEISKHNREADCWLLISDKVYDITSFFGSHPGGNGAMAATCGTDATSAYNSKDPYASTSVGGNNHSSKAKSMLDQYFVGNYNQKFTSKINNGTNPLPSGAGTTVPAPSTIVLNPTIIPKPKPVIASNITLTLAELSKHNRQSDCWLLINNKIYDITSFFGSHPGGNGTMSATCGTDATNAYSTKDPNASTSGGGSAHSSRAVSLLANYYIGSLNQNVTTNTIQTVKTTPDTNNNGIDGEDDD